MLKKRIPLYNGYRNSFIGNFFDTALSKKFDRQENKRQSNIRAATRALGLEFLERGGIALSLNEFFLANKMLASCAGRILRQQNFFGHKKRFAFRCIFLFVKKKYLPEGLRHNAAYNKFVPKAHIIYIKNKKVFYETNNL